MKCEMCDGEMVEFMGQWHCLLARCPEYRPVHLPEGESTLQVESSMPTQVPPSEPVRGHGIKLDTGKPPVFAEFLMQFPDAIELVAWIGDKGSRAPGHVRSGWKTVPHGYERYSDAFGRHILEEARRLTASEAESEDPDFDLIFQTATVAWNAMARLQLLAKEKPDVLRRIFGTN